MDCAYHPDREPVGACVSCGKLICVECKTVMKEKIYCNPCAERIFIKNVPDELPEEPKSTAKKQEFAKREDVTITPDTSEQTSKGKKPDQTKKTQPNRKKLGIIVFGIVLLLCILGFIIYTIFFPLVITI
jgi:DNA-directed RNA polymerase subunit RPC12/RpoP